MLSIKIFYEGKGLFILGFIVVFFFWVILLGILAKVQNVDLRNIYLLHLTLVLSVLSFLIIIGISELYKGETTRQIEVDNISISGNAYLTEKDGNTLLFKKNKHVIEIGEKNFIEYSRKYYMDNLFTEFFGFSNESEIKESSDKEFIEGADVVFIGIDKDSIK